MCPSVLYTLVSKSWRIKGAFNKMPDQWPKTMLHKKGCAEKADVPHTLYITGMARLCNDFGWIEYKNAHLATPYLNAEYSLSHAR